ncbi:MAG: DUF4139 domain-containing protein [Pseudomonadota bacterium]
MKKAFVLLSLLVLLPAHPVLANNQVLRLSLADRTAIDLTIYSNFAVVRDVRETVLPSGTFDLEFEHVAHRVDGGSVMVRSLTGGNELSVLSQSYQFDLLNKQSLLERYIGRKLKYSRSVLQDNKYEKYLREGILLSIDPEIVQFGDEIEIAPEGVVSLPYIPEGLKTIPTLVWKVNNRVKGVQKIETSYVSDAFNWQAEHLLTLNAREDAFDLSTRVSVENQSGINYDRARINLVAGDVNREQKSTRVLRDAPMMMRAEAVSATADVGPEALGDIYLYRIPGEVDIKHHETRQLRLFDARNIKVKRTYKLVTPVMTHQNPQPETRRFDVTFAFENTQRNGLGDPFPAGRVRVFKDDAGALRLLGEDRVRHTPGGETIEFTTGKAFDLVAERTQKSWRRLGDRAAEVTYEIALRNAKREGATLVLQEKLYGDWSIVSQTADGAKLDSTTQQYIIDLKAGESRTFTYTARTVF